MRRRRIAPPPKRHSRLWRLSVLGFGTQQWILLLTAVAGVAIAWVSSKGWFSEMDPHCAMAYSTAETAEDTLVVDAILVGSPSGRRPHRCGDYRVMDEVRVLRDSPTGSSANMATSTQDVSAGSAAAPTFPFLIEYPDSCPGEGCLYGEWLVCEDVTLYASPGGAVRPGETLAAGDRFDALTGVVVVDRPTVIVATQPVEQRLSQTDTLRIAEGDTVLVLDHQGEGFFHIWYGRLMSGVDFFWNAPGATRPADEYAAEVLSEGSYTFWAATLRSAGDTAWVRASPGAVARRSNFSPSPIC